MKRQHLFTPGPVNVAENVRAATSKGDICHREPEFDRLLASVESKLLSAFEIRKRDSYRAVVITGSGSAANEAILSSAVGDRKILILSNGEFGERLHTISRIHNPSTFHLKLPWADKIDPLIVERYVIEHRIEAIAMVHHETCAGMLNPIEAIGAIALAHGAMFIVDCVSSAGADKINVEASHIDFCSSSSSKAIGSYAGLSVVIGRTAEFEKLKNNPAKTAYLNLATFYEFLKRRSQTPNTPAIQLIYALDESLTNILSEGSAQRQATCKRRASLLRAGMRGMGLSFLIDQKDMSAVLTTVMVPSYTDVASIQHKLRKKSVIIYEGKGPFRGLVFQVGNIGAISDEDIGFFLMSLKSVLAELAPVKVMAKSNLDLLYRHTPLPIPRLAARAKTL